MNKSITYILFSSILSVLFYSCNPYKEIVYLQDATVNEVTKVQNYQGITIQPYDRLVIIITCKTPELALPFNLSSVSYQLDGVSSSINQQPFLFYTVDKNGNIDMPILGEIHAEGFSEEQLVEHIKDILVEQNYIKNPTVTVQFINLNIYIGGEVASPGVYEITKNHITLLEAIAMAGDLTAYGKRDNVKVIREKNGERIIYSVDLRTAELFNSPAYYLQQNDFIYVEPVNTARKNLPQRPQYLYKNNK
jgi:polysaccharide export outer membrane protein